MEKTYKEKQFYVYVHCRPSGEPFYVGKGSGNRATNFTDASLNKRSLHYRNIVKKYGRDNILIYVLNSASEKQAFEYEVWMIAWCRAKKYRIVNMTSGGEGTTGHPRSAKQLEHNKRSAQWMRGNKNLLGYRFSEESRLRMSAAKVGRKRGPMSTEQKQILSDLRIGRSLSLEVRMKMSLSKIGVPWTAARRAAFYARRSK